MPDLVGLKRAAETETGNSKTESGSKRQKLIDADVCPNRVFISKLPLTINKSQLEEWLGEIKNMHWLTDKNTGAFYGSCAVELRSKEAAEVVLQKQFPKFGKKKPRVVLAKQRKGEVWPPVDQKNSTFPPVGN